MSGTRAAPPPEPGAARPSTPAKGAALPVATLAKAALRRLAQSQTEPTPENYARAYAEESGATAPKAREAAASADDKAAGQSWSALAERLVRNLERGGRQWSAARRKESLKRVFDGSRNDAPRLLQRLQSLMTAWETDQPGDPAQTGVDDPPQEAAPHGDGNPGAWPALVAALHGAVGAALPPAVAHAAQLAAELGRLADAVASEGATPAHAAAIAAVCAQAQRLFAHRHRLVDELGALCRELTSGLTELAEDDSWAHGQCEVMRATLDDDQGLSVRGVRAAAVLLAEARSHQQRLRGQRQAARDALRQLLHDMLLEVGELGDHAGRFQLATAQHALAIEQADTLEGLAEVVKALLLDTRTVQSAVGQSQQRLQADRERATELEGKVRELEGELRRLSEEVSTDALTQVANRRGLTQAFEAESARCLREQAQGGAGLAVGLIDIDNFKKLNDSLGHAIGDVALKTLAASVRERLRPVDHLARFGGEEFVVLMRCAGAEAAQLAFERLRRNVEQFNFPQVGRITVSVGFTGLRAGDTPSAAFERADRAVYHAKTHGRNQVAHHAELVARGELAEDAKIGDVELF